MPKLCKQNRRSVAISRVILRQIDAIYGNLLIDQLIFRASSLNRGVGFVLDGESDVLANSEDDHTKSVFDPEIRGKTDRYALRFRKPE